MNVRIIKDLISILMGHARTQDIKEKFLPSNQKYTKHTQAKYKYKSVKLFFPKKKLLLFFFQINEIERPGQTRLENCTFKKV